MSLQKDTNQEGQICSTLFTISVSLSFSLSVSLSLSLSVSITIFLSLSLFPHPWNPATTIWGWPGICRGLTCVSASAPLQVSANGQHHWERASLQLFQLPFFKSSSWDPRRCRAEKLKFLCWNSWPIESRSLTNGSFILLSFRVIYYVSIVTVIS